MVFKSFARSAGKVLLASNLYSIDEFLSNHPPLQSWGKQSIAIRILMAEMKSQRSACAAGSEEQDWLKLLWNEIALRPEDFAYHKLAFVTFNYDRLLEHYLTTSMANSYGVPPMVAWNAISRLKIIHLHGQVGRYQPEGPPRSIDDQPSISFGDQVLFPLMETCANSFKLGWESTKDGSRVEEASRLIAAARVVVVLGVGRAASLLSPFADAIRSVVHSGGVAYATGYGLREAERRPLSDLRLQVADPGIDAALLLRDRIHFPSFC